jgi:transcriptional regulator with XRE-family HTH domain
VTTGHDLSFGNLLRRYRSAAGLTQEELAERAGLSARAVSDIERVEQTLLSSQAEWTERPGTGEGAR